VKAVDLTVAYVISGVMFSQANGRIGNGCIKTPPMCRVEFDRTIVRCRDYSDSRNSLPIEHLKGARARCEIL
jgi:hypothetical protein